MRLAPLVVALLGASLSVWSAPSASAEDVLICWGDSILAGFNDTGNTTTPYGPAPFGDPLPGAHRWEPESMTWVPVTPYQNYFGTSADPVYGFAAGWRRFHGGDVYIIALGVPGSDVTPDHLNPRGSWHPSVQDGTFATFEAAYLQPALASLVSPEIRAIFFTAGNNRWTLDFPLHVEAINSELEAYTPGSDPQELGVMTYFGTPNDANTLLQRQSMVAWTQAGPRRHAVDAVSVPSRTGGLVDMFHLTHFGSIYLGFLAALTEYLAP